MLEDNQYHRGKENFIFLAGFLIGVFLGIMMCA